MLLNRASVALKIAIAVFLVAILVRLFFVVNESLNPTKDFSSMVLNSEIARNLVGGRGLVFDATRLVLLKKIEEKVGHKIDPADADEFLKGQVHVSNYQPAKSYEPGYPLFLAGLWKITGEKKFIFPSLVQVFLGGIAAIGVFSITRSFFALPVAALAGFLYALYIPEAKMSVVPYQYPWVGFITVFFIDKNAFTKGGGGILLYGDSGWNCCRRRDFNVLNFNFLARFGSCCFLSDISVEAGFYGDIINVGGFYWPAFSAFVIQYV